MQPLRPMRKCPRSESGRSATGRLAKALFPARDGGAGRASAGPTSPRAWSRPPGPFKMVTSMSSSHPHADRWVAAFDAMPIAIVVAWADGEAATLNPAARRLLSGREAIALESPALRRALAGETI